MTNENREYFTKEEAEALVGKHIRTLVAWSGVPINTTGRVVSADENGGWTVAIQWDLPINPHSIGSMESTDEPLLAISGGKPLVDWFSKSEYQKYLEEIEGAEKTVPRIQRTKELYLGEIGIDAYAEVEVIPGDAKGQTEEVRLIIKKPSGQMDVRISEEDLLINFYSFLIRE